MKKRVVAYCRVSTNKKDQENSLENQQTYFSRTISDNPDFELCGIYADKGISGTVLDKRPEFNRMLIDAGLDIENGYKIIDKPKFDHIFTKNTSRFARNVSVDVILKALARNKVYVRFLDLNKTTENIDDFSYIHFFQVLDERESVDKSKKVSFGMIEGAKRGVILCNNKIYGYKYHARPENRLEIIPEEAEVIRRIFALYNDGIGAYRIENIFKQEGVMNRNGEPFLESSIRAILKNEKYYGLVTRMKYDTGEVFRKHTTAKKRPESEQIRFTTDKVPAIIDEDTFFKAQAIREGRYQHKTQKGINHGSTDYAQKIFCGCCGAQYRANQTKFYENRRERYYACTKKRKTAYEQDGKRRMLCVNPNITESYLDEELSNDNYAFLRADNIVEAICLLELIREELKLDLKVDHSEQLERLRVEKNKAEEKIGRLLDLRADGKVDSNYVNKAVEPLQAQAKDLQGEIDALEKPTYQKRIDIAEINDSIERLSKRRDEIFDFETEQAVGKHSRKDILKDVKRIIVGRDRQLRIIFNSFEEVVSVLEKHKSILPGGIAEDFIEIAKQGKLNELVFNFLKLAEKPKLNEVLDDMQSRGYHIQAP